ncbi:unnamed protein product [Chrysodeixis includens]|uniref:N-acetyltransferase domain-containing protein n=1 Tax=Chrysodeixis includens TaxID=689277 RepID=A0A9P0BU18_CHRIL|nr:unnamed protein product [Chrysodeixis includens]
MGPQQPECEIVVRAARASDLPARAELVRRGLTDHDFEAFLMFFFQELTLQVCVLGGAVLFIFVGASPAACALVVPGAALCAGAAVWVSHRARAAQAARACAASCAGWWPSTAARWRPAACRRACACSRGRARARRAPGGHGQRERGVGWRGCTLAVDARWRRRGVGAALEAACRQRAAAAQLEALETAVSALQDAARGLLHAAGWTTLASFHRPVLGAALTLPMTHLTVDLPLA